MIGTSTWNSVITAALTDVSADVAIAVSAGGRMKANTKRPTASRMIFSSILTPFRLKFKLSPPISYLL